MADDLAAENARLQAELRALRAQQSGGVHPAIAQHENAAAQQWSAADQQIKALEKQHSELLSEGKFDESVALQKTIAALSNRQEYARQQWASWNGMRQASPVEQFLAANRGTYTPEDENWIRQHPDFCTDGQFRQAIIEAHNEALQDGYQRGTPAYFARMDRRASEHGGGGAGRGDPPMLAGDMLDTARSSYTAIFPDRQTASPAEISKWWHEQSHSPAAHRIRESMAGSSYQTFRGRW
jgi:hypothetical protein